MANKPKKEPQPIRHTLDTLIYYSISLFLENSVHEAYVYFMFCCQSLSSLYLSRYFLNEFLPTTLLFMCRDQGSSWESRHCPPPSGQADRWRWDMPRHPSPHMIWLWLGWVFNFSGSIFCHLHLCPWPTMKWALPHRQDLSPLFVPPLSTFVSPLHNPNGLPKWYLVFVVLNSSTNCSERHFIQTWSKHQKFQISSLVGFKSNLCDSFKFCWTFDYW